MIKVAVSFIRGLPMWSFPNSRCRVAAMYLFASLSASCIAADVVSTWDGSTNIWTSSHWSSPDYPNNGNAGFTYDAVISSGTVTLDQDITIEDFAFSNGTLTAISPFILTINDLLTWSGGTMSGTGTTTVGSLGTLAINTPTGSNVFLQQSLVNNRVATWTGSATYGIGFNGGTFTNNGSFTASTDTTIDASSTGGTNVFNNNGTFTKTGAGTARFYLYNGGNGVPFNNSGTVDIQAGTLHLLSGGTHSGDFTIATGATLTLNGNYTFAATSDVSGAGTLNVFVGNTTFDGQLSPTGNLNVSVGTANINSTTTVGTLTMMSGTLSGSGTIAVSGTTTWSGGTMSGTGTTTVSSSATLAINTPSGSNIFLQRSLINDGTATWTGSATHGIGFNDGTFTNNGSFTANTDTAIDASSLGGTNAFNNNGTFTKTGAGTTRFYLYNGGNGVPFNNSGTVDIQAGNLRLESGGTHTGDFSIAEGATLWLSGTHTFAATSEVSGAGMANVFGGNTTIDGQLSTNIFNFSGGMTNINSETLGGIVVVSGGTANFNNSLTAATLNLSAGQLAGTGDVTILGTATWTAGSMGGTGQTIIPAAGTLLLTGNNPNGPILSRTLVNNGTVNWTGASDLQFNNSAFVNNGTVTLTSDVQLYISSAGGTNSFDNVGTFRKQGSGTTRVLGVSFVNSGDVYDDAGTLDIQSGGIHSKDFWVADGATLTFGSGNQFRRGQVFVDNGGTVGATSGTLTFRDTDETVAATLLNYGTVTSGVLFEGAFYRGAGTIEHNLTLRGGLVRDLPGSGPIEVKGDLYVELPVLSTTAPSGSKFIEGTMIVDGTVHVNAPFLVDSDSVLLGAVGGNVKFNIEDGGSINLENGGQLGGTNREVTVKVRSGGKLEGNGPIVGSLDLGGGQVTGDHSLKNLIVSEASNNDGNINIPGTAQIDGDLSGSGTVNSTNLSGGGTTSNKAEVGTPGQLQVDTGHSPGRLTITNSASDALTLVMPDNPGDGHFNFEINNATGTAGMNPGWDELVVSQGGVVFEGAAGAGMTISMFSLIGNNTPGALSNFDRFTPYVWRFLDTALGFSGVAVEDFDFVVDDTQFASINGIPTGRFSVIQDSPTSLALSFRPLIPGDFNANDVVDAADYVIWRKGLGTIHTQDDYNI